MSDFQKKKAEATPEWYHFASGLQENVSLPKWFFIFLLHPSCCESDVIFLHNQQQTNILYKEDTSRSV